MSDPSLVWKTLVVEVIDKQLNYAVLFPGVIPPNPAHLLANGNFETLINKAKLIYDYVIVDMAPTILVTDTLLVSHLSDATLCVVRANYTEKKLVSFSEDLSKSN